MGFMDAFKNESFETPAKGGLSKAAKTVVGEYKGKKVTATVGAKMQTAASALGLPVSYNC
tara:strand:- start:176 stop:355 length:180 start_codon:yes stop_codon:yes gene_type:complete